MENTGKIEEAIMPFKIQQLAEVIMQKKHIGFPDALHYLYSSDFYPQLLSEETKWWYMSSLALYEIIEAEKKKEQKTVKDNRKLTLFFVFCLESYKKHTDQSAETVLTMFSTYKVFDFLKENFDVLHTQGKEYLMEEIEEFFKSRKK